MSNWRRTLVSLIQRPMISSRSWIKNWTSSNWRLRWRSLRMLIKIGLSLAKGKKRLVRWRTRRHWCNDSMKIVLADSSLSLKNSRSKLASWRRTKLSSTSTRRSSIRLGMCALIWRTRKSSTRNCTTTSRYFRRRRKRRHHWRIWSPNYSQSLVKWNTSAIRKTSVSRRSIFSFGMRSLVWKISSRKKPSTKLRSTN